MYIWLNLTTRNIKKTECILKKNDFYIYILYPISKENTQLETYISDY